MSLMITTWVSATAFTYAHSDRGHRNPSTGLNDGVGQIRYHVFATSGYPCIDMFMVGY
jgi:hypothetical protein